MSVFKKLFGMGGGDSIFAKMRRKKAKKKKKKKEKEGIITQHILDHVLIQGYQI